MKKENVEILASSMDLYLEEDSEGYDITYFDVNDGIFNILKESKDWKKHGFKIGIDDPNNFKTDYFSEYTEDLTVYIKFTPDKSESKDGKPINFKVIEKNGKLTFEEFDDLFVF